MKAKIILIGNYQADKQYSMQIFEALMAEGYSKSKLNVNTIRPKELFRKVSFSKSSLMKWLAYVDKFLIFPIYLLILRLTNIFLLTDASYHICDHSNAFYLHFLPKNKTIITCHDVLAIRAGLGYEDTYCSVTKSGVIFQKIIINALCDAKKLAAVSKFTLNQLNDIDNKPNKDKSWVCIHNALSDKFKPMLKPTIQEVLKKFKILEEKIFILHVGSDLARKNRKLLIFMIYELQKDWDGYLVLAGEPLNLELLDLINKLKVSDRIVQIHYPTDQEIIALYSKCEAMIFPSFSEGFGWPIIEAQACGAPVITSNIAPMMNEVGGNAALYADPDNPSSFADKFREFNDKKFRNEIITLGHENVKRFDFDRTVRQYVELINN